MVERKTKNIDGVTFEVAQFPAFQAVIFLGRLTKLMGPGILGLLQSLMGRSLGDVLGSNVAAFAPIFRQVAEGLEPEAFAKLCLDMLRNTYADNVQLDKQGTFDATFTGHLDRLWPALFFVLDANDFFGFGAIGRRLQVKLPSSQPSTPTSSAS